jgi:hypothetical protein
MVGQALPWFPGLAAELVAGFWKTNPCFCESAYGSTRWLLDDPLAPQDIVVVLMVNDTAIALERLPATLCAGTEPIDLRLIDRSPETRDLDLLRSAFDRLNVAPGLLASVLALVRSMHILAAEPGYDVSHSDPAIPFSIFVSLPVSEPEAGLRLAESILHEAMHLQLTLIERNRPLVHEDGGTGYSPWQGTERPISGLVHGLYVFRVIDAWLRYLEQLDDEEGRIYAARRRREIADEIIMLAGLAASPKLTWFGGELVRMLLSDDPGAVYQV